MNITITTDAKDDEVLSGFAKVTGWDAKYPGTLADWLKEKVIEFIKQQASSGMLITATQASRDAYIADVTAASVIVEGKIGSVTITDVGGGVVGLGGKVIG